MRREIQVWTPTLSHKQCSVLWWWDSTLHTLKVRRQCVLFGLAGWLLQKQLEELGLDGDLICDLKQQLQGNPGQSVLDQVTSLFSATVGPHSQPDQKDGAPSSSSEASSSTQTAASPSKGTRCLHFFCSSSSRN